MTAPDPGLTDTCNNCGKPIKWVGYRWRHDYAGWRWMLTCERSITNHRGLTAYPAVRYG